MDREKQIKACELRIDGWNIDDIARELQERPVDIKFLFLSVRSYRCSLKDSYYPNFKMWLLENNVSKQKLSTQIGMAWSTLALYLTGENAYIPPAISQKCEEITGIPRQILFSRELVN